VDGIGIADCAPGPDENPALSPRLTCDMVTRLQGWQDDWGWRFSGRKTARYRQIGHAFPPPVAQAVGSAIRRAFEHAGAPAAADASDVHDPVFLVLRSRADFLTARQIADLTRVSPGELSQAAVLGRLRHLGQDFELEVADSGDGPAYRLGPFKAFLGQPGHVRHQRFAAWRATIS
jgi:DNA (cytosine-5)-methyltransferase 1